MVIGVQYPIQATNIVAVWAASIFPHQFWVPEIIFHVAVEMAGVIGKIHVGLAPEIQLDLVGVARMPSDVSD